MTTDRIEKQILLRAPRHRVWRALSDSTEFGAWFGMKFDLPFTPGAHMRGVIVPTQADPEVARMQEKYTGVPVEMMIEQLEPERRFSFRWHPGAVEPGMDYSKEPTTLVAFELQEVPDGTLLTVTETGFDQIPLARRAKVFAANEQGWSLQVMMIDKHVSHAH
jgi:uncharacterized protein YndB with AHSA1/START domain